MSDIAPINTSRLEGLILDRAGKVQRAKPVSQEAPSRGRDNVELSDHSRYLSQLRELPSVRQDVVDSIKARIEAGTYETADKIEAAIDALSEDLG